MRREAADLTRLKVLKMIRRQGPISRVELAATTGLAGSTITEITADLLRRGLLAEQQLKSVVKGRARTLLSIDRASLSVIGASLNFDGVLEVSLVDLEGGRRHTQAYQLRRSTTTIELLQTIASKLHGFIGEFANLTDIGYVGLVLPALLQSPEGIVCWVPTLSDDDIPAGQILSDLLDLPTFIENDFDCLARAEHWFGLPIAADDFTVIQVGMSLGMAEYLDGRPRVGANGFNAEFAHTKSIWGTEARPCFCGARGCLTAYASIAGVLHKSTHLIADAETDTHDILQSFQALTTAANNGDAEALAAFANAGTHLGVALANLVNCRDPGTVLVRFSDPDLMRFVEEDLLAAFDQNCLPQIRAQTAIDIAVFQDDWLWKGAAALALEQTYLSAPLRSLDDRARPPASTRASSGRGGHNLAVVGQNK